jgi:hypothetical protein
MGEEKRVRSWSKRGEIIIEGRKQKRKIHVVRKKKRVDEYLPQVKYTRVMFLEPSQ